MIDCNIDICNLAILWWIKDDPNLKSLNSNFINGVVESEISSDKVFYYEIKDSYFSKITSYNTYFSAIWDIQNKKMHPFTFEKMGSKLTQNDPCLIGLDNKISHETIIVCS